MDKEAIKAKFGAYYCANELTFRMGLDVRFANHLADRFQGRTVLETCTGGGFTTIALARKAKHVVSVEIDLNRQAEAEHNAFVAGVAERITFIWSDIFNVRIRSLSEQIDAALIDPDWADTNSNHEYRFINSTTRPASDKIFKYISEYTTNITLVQPPLVAECEFDNLPKHEREKLYMDGKLELWCLHFGGLVRTTAPTEYRV
jgi:16S rRNA G966 N2-methylase RsmD